MKTLKKIQNSYESCWVFGHLDQFLSQSNQMWSEGSGYGSFHDPTELDMSEKDPFLKEEGYFSQKNVQVHGRHTADSSSLYRTAVG